MVKNLYFEGLEIDATWRKIFTLKVLKLMPRGALKIEIAF
jgi:hypothetical protein